MISICIPVYNCDVQNLVNELVSQSGFAKIPFEILLIDDFSEQSIRNVNKHLAKIEGVSYIELEKNIGRSAIRNLFLKYTKFNYLLFLDCDSEIPYAQFIEKYIECIDQNSQVICGGRAYEKEIPRSKEFRLRWKYGIERECIPSKIRNKSPYKSFLSNNFLIVKKVFEQSSFNELIRNYGHEDTLFGYQLEQNHITIKHIDNPLIHKYSENSREFLKKTRLAIENLHFIYFELRPGEDFANSVKLLRFFFKLKKTKLNTVFAILFIILKPFMYWILIKMSCTCLLIFDFYKLCYLCSYNYKHKPLK